MANFSGISVDSHNGDTQSSKIVLMFYYNHQCGNWRHCTYFCEQATHWTLHSIMAPNISFPEAQPSGWQEQQQCQEDNLSTGWAQVEMSVEPEEDTTVVGAYA